MKIKVLGKYHELGIERKSNNFKQSSGIINKLYIFEKDSKEYKSYFNYCVTYFDFLCKKRIKKYRQKNNYDDLLQEARIALIMALKSYDISKGTCKDGRYFTWWANIYINEAVVRAIRKENRQKNTRQEIELVESRSIENIEIINIIDKLSSIERQFIKYKLDSLIENEIRENTGMSRRKYWQILNSLRKKFSFLIN